jgi:rRNA maturation endonuclease Nob1
VKARGEQYECANCFLRVSLDEHGGCERCHSQAVISIERIELLLSNQVRPQQAMPA